MYKYIDSSSFHGGKELKIESVPINREMAEQLVAFDCDVIVLFYKK